jgi:cytoskeletal protein CcmA (bactofilin family)
VEVGAAYDTLAVGGRLTATRFSSAQVLQVAGPVRVQEQLRLAGFAVLEATLEAGELQSQGSLRVAKDVTVRDHLATTGQFEAGGAVKATTIDARGRVTIPGSVTARIVDLRLEGHCRIGRIKAETVGIRPRSLLGRGTTVKIDRIEAETVDLEAAEVEFVRAPTIRLGRNAHLVRYEGNVVHRHSSAHVGPESHSPRPHGLAR